ncbi:hypothetical protein [Sphingomonas oryzagri]|uniref:Uncharacterized protein n=1 Tax=Sphingomonas oryzagri TaxID=3042314 RepID=A0ABT6N5T1_9SPHN|nr:hypothetical protein [Sphingomonas oryzagri]MDH7640461.1 hypothetical protein [Sphingomonas oryzagri]
MISTPDDQAFARGWQAAWSMFEAGVVIEKPHHSQVHMIWCEGGPAPRHLHRSWKSARDEAERLAKANPSKRFHILSSAQIYSLPVVERSHG